MPSPCCETCKETCGQGEKCGSDCKCGPSCECCSAAAETPDKCKCATEEEKCACPEGSCK